MGTGSVFLDLIDERRFREIFVTQDMVEVALCARALSYSSARHEHDLGYDEWEKRQQNATVPFKERTFPTEERVTRAKEAFEEAWEVARSLGYEVRPSWRHYLSPRPTKEEELELLKSGKMEEMPTA